MSKDDVEDEGTVIIEVVVEIVLESEKGDEVALEVTTPVVETAVDRGSLDDIDIELDVEVKVADIVLGTVVLDVEGIQIDSNELISELRSGTEYGKLAVNGTETELVGIGVGNQSLLKLKRLEVEMMLMGVFSDGKVVETVVPVVKLIEILLVIVDRTVATKSVPVPTELVPSEAG